MIRKVRVAPELAEAMLTTGYTTNGELLVTEGLPIGARLVAAEVRGAIPGHGCIELTLSFDVGGEPGDGPDINPVIHRGRPLPLGVDGSQACTRCGEVRA